VELLSVVQNQEVFQMKKFVLLVALVLMASAMMLAQTQTTFSGAAGSAAPTVDVLGAHNNYGRGCAGCHAPHSGAFGAGGNAAANGSVSNLFTGTNALFAQDMGPLFGKTFDFSDISTTGSANKYLLVAPATGNPTTWTAQQYSDARGILMCLACHDGNVAKGAMMKNQAYEQQIGALPSTYGKGAIPTLLGNDGTAAGTYNNDHPVGESATINAVLGTAYGDAGNGLVYTITGTTISAAPVAHGQYSQFMTSYGAPALMKGAHSYGTPVNATGAPYVVCTTCHNQHVMNIYAASTNSPIAGSPTGTYGTFFFINGPYDVANTTVPPTSAASTTQFCRQCHFGESNEANGGTLSTVF
jgi:cytochrome c553